MLPVFPTAYFGSIAYFRELARFDEVIIEIHEHFPKQTLRNRCEILGAQGVIRLTLPVSKPNGTKTPTYAIACSDQEDWKTIHLRTITTAYAAAPYFEHYISDIRALLETPTNSLIELNLRITQFLLSTWGINTKLKLSSEYVAQPIIDFRNTHFELNSQNILFYTQISYNTHQVFNPSLSVLDLLFCEGPMGRRIII